VKTISLRTLMREPLKVKRWTRSGETVQVTDNGKPLWVIQSAEESGDEAARHKLMDQIFEEVAREPILKPSLSELIQEGRR
jgi:hypothetical protein